MFCPALLIVEIQNSNYLTHLLLISLYCFTYGKLCTRQDVPLDASIIAYVDDYFSKVLLKLTFKLLCTPLEILVLPAYSMLGAVLSHIIMRKTLFSQESCENMSHIILLAMKFVIPESPSSPLSSLFLVVP